MMVMVMVIAILLLLMKNKKKMMMMGIGQKWTRSRTYPRCRSHVTTNPNFFFIAVACTLNIKPEKLARQWKFCGVWEVKDLRFRGGMHYQALPWRGLQHSDHFDTDDGHNDHLDRDDIDKHNCNLDYGDWALNPRCEI